jgi:hypothetical protein
MDYETLSMAMHALTVVFAVATFGLPGLLVLLSN